MVNGPWSRTQATCSHSNYHRFGADRIRLGHWKSKDAGEDHPQFRALGVLTLMVVFGTGVDGQRTYQGTEAQRAAVKRLENVALTSTKTAAVGTDVMQLFGYEAKCHVPAKQLKHLTADKDTYYVNWLVYEAEPCAWPPQWLGPIAAGNFKASDVFTMIFVVKKPNVAVFYLTDVTLALRKWQDISESMKETSSDSEPFGGQGK